MLRRTIAAVAVGVVLLGWASPASGERSDRLFLFNATGLVAHGQWEDSTGTSYFIEADRRSLLVAIDRWELDAAGALTGSTTTIGVLTTGYSFDATYPMQRVTVQAADVPAEACAYDAEFTLIGCHQTTIGPVDVTFQGVGSVRQDREVSHHHFPGRVVTLKNADFERDVVITGNVGGAPVPAGAVGDMHHVHGAGVVSICTGTACSRM